MLLQLVHNLSERRHVFRVFFAECLFNLFDNRFKSCLTDIFVVGIKRVFHLFRNKIGDSVIEIHVDADFFKIGLFLADFVLNPFDKRDDLLAFLMRSADCFKHGILGHFVCAGFNHDDLFRRSGDR